MDAPRQQLGKLAASMSQGASLSRYRHPGGKALGVVNIRNLHDLWTGGELEVDTFLPGAYLSNTLDAGDVVIANRGTVLKASVISPEHEGAIASSNIAVFKPDSQRDLDPIYLAGLLRSSWMGREVEKLFMQSRTIQLINLKQLRDLEIPCPPLEAQRMIADLFLQQERFVRVTGETIAVREGLIEAALTQAFGDQ